MLKCPECGKEVSSAASTCPHCGYPLKQKTDDNIVKNDDDGSNNSKPEKIAKTSNNKKKLTIGIIAILIVLVLAVAGGFIVPQIVANYKEKQQEDKYNQAGELVIEGKYNDAIELYTQLGKFKDSESKATSAKYALAEKYLKSEQYVLALTLYSNLGSYKDSAVKAKIAQQCQTPKGQFLYDLSCALSARWAIKMSNEDSVFLCPEDEVYSLVDAELSILSKYDASKIRSIKDAEFEEHIQNYIKALKDSRNIISTIKTEESQDKWGDYYDDRLENIAYFYDNGLTMNSKKDQDRLNEMYYEYQDKEIYDEICSNVSLVSHRFDYESNNLILTIKNDSKYSLSYMQVNCNFYKEENGNKKLVNTNTSNMLYNVDAKSTMVFEIYAPDPNTWNAFYWSAMPYDDFEYKT